MVLVVYLVHAIFTRGRSVIFLQISLWGDVLSSQIEEPKKQSGSPLS